MVDASGQIVSQSRYLPFGEVLWEDGTSPTDYTYTGQRSLSDIGLMDYNARFYDPMLGRFTSPDSIVPDAGSVIGYNRFAYVNNNPVRYTDPSGHCYTSSGVYIPGGGEGDCSFRTETPMIITDPITGNPYVQDEPYIVQTSDEETTYDVVAGWEGTLESTSIWTYEFINGNYAGREIARFHSSKTFVTVNIVSDMIVYTVVVEAIAGALLTSVSYPPAAPIVIPAMIELGQNAIQRSSTRFDDPTNIIGEEMRDIATIHYDPVSQQNIPNPITVIVMSPVWEKNGFESWDSGANTLVIIQNQATYEGEFISIPGLYLQDILTALDDANEKDPNNWTK